MKARLHFVNCIVCALVILLALRPSGRVLAGSYNCSAYANLQACVNAAVEGDILIIDPGTYTVNLLIHDKGIILRGSTQAVTTIQAADSSQRVITADAKKDLHLENLTITGGHPAGSGGGGIYAAGGTLYLVNCRITSNSATYGGGIYLDDAASSLVVSFSLIDQNQASFDGGGIFSTGNATIAVSQLDQNNADRHGGGLHAQASAALNGAVFTDNHAATGNGGAVNVNNGLFIVNSQFLNNTSSVLGGAVSQWNSPFTVSISGSTFISNTASGSAGEIKGGAAYIAGSLTLTNSTFNANLVDTLASGNDGRGGGLYSLGALNVDGATFTGNEVKCQYCSYNEGGGICSGLTTGTVEVVNSTFDGNKAWFGSGINASDLVVTHSAFLNGGGGSKGGYGGGIDAYSMTGDDLLFQNNSVLNSGGAVDSTHVTMTHSRFIGNNAGAGGGAMNIHGVFSGSNLLFAGNHASANGAALYLRQGADGSFYNITIAQPAQGTGPAVNLALGARLSLYNSIVNNYTDAIYLTGTGSTLTEDYNLLYGNTVDIYLGSGSSYSMGTHTLRGFAPGFLDPAGGNYRLRSTSKAIGGGHNYGLADDLDFHPRLNGRNDIGAYQFYPVVYLPLVVR